MVLPSFPLVRPGAPARPGVGLEGSLFPPLCERRPDPPTPPPLRLPLAVHGWRQRPVRLGQADRELRVARPHEPGVGAGRGLALDVGMAWSRKNDLVPARRPRRSSTPDAAHPLPPHLPARAPLRRYNGFFHKVLPKAQVAVLASTSLYTIYMLLTQQAGR
jgi:hypothetical protein